MKNLLYRFVESQFDLDEFKRALEEKIVERLDYSSLAASVLDRCEDEFAQVSVDAAEEFLSCLE